MRYVIHITTLKEPVRFFAQGITREEARPEGLCRWPLDATNQPCGLRVEESRWLFAELEGDQ